MLLSGWNYTGQRLLIDVPGLLNQPSEACSRVISWQLPMLLVLNHLAPNVDSPFFDTTRKRLATA